MISKLKMAIILLIASVVMPITVFAENGKELTELLGIKIGKRMTLRDVQRRLGKVQIVESGELESTKLLPVILFQHAKQKSNSGLQNSEVLNTM